MDVSRDIHVGCTLLDLTLYIYDQRVCYSSM